MANLLTWLRLPALILGLLLLFVADRYLGTESYHLALRIAAMVLVALSVVMTFMLSTLSAGRGLAGEARGWRQLCLWQVAVLAALGLYMAYGKMLGDKPAPDTAGAKVLLGAWAVLLVLGLAAGIGGEWAMRATGRGETAEPERIGRAGLAWLAVGMLFCFLVSINYAADKKDVQRDWSYLKVRTPSESTTKMVHALSADLTVALFYPQSNEVKTAVSDYISALAQDPHIKVEWYDKDMAPTKAEEYRVSRNGQIVLDMKGKKSRIDTGTELAKAKKTLKGFDGEFQKAFLETTSDRKTLYFTRGHGEFSWVGEAGDNPLRSLRLIEGFLKQQNYSTRLFGIAEGSATAIPDDASAVVIVGPTEAFQKEEIDALRTYMEHGGNLMVFMDLEKSTGQVEAPAEAGQPLDALLADMGLTYNRVPLGNEKNHVAATHSDSDMWFIYTNIFTSHESVVSLARHDERVALLAYQTGYFTVKQDAGKWKATETVRALSDTFADANRNFKFDQGEKRDAFVLGAAAELKDQKPDPKTGGKAAKRQGRVIAFADATATSDAIVRNPGNALFVADSLKWLVGESETQGELASEEDVKIRHTRKEDVVWFHGTVIVVPLLVLGAGFLATRRRRSGKEKDKVTTDAA